MVSSRYLNNRVMHIEKQKGVVLVVSLVFLIALTAVAAALMQNTTTDMKMSGASEEKVVAEQEVVSAIDEFIFKQKNSGTGNNGFAQSPVKFNDGAQSIIADLTSTNKNGDIDSATLDIVNNRYGLEQSCPRFSSGNASAAGTITCNILQIQIRRKYGRNNTSTVEANSGIVQPLL